MQSQAMQVQHRNDDGQYAEAGERHVGGVDAAVLPQGSYGGRVEQSGEGRPRRGQRRRPGGRRQNRQGRSRGEGAPRCRSLSGHRGLPLLGRRGRAGLASFSA